MRVYILCTKFEFQNPLFHIFSESKPCPCQCFTTIVFALVSVSFQPPPIFLWLFCLLWSFLLSYVTASRHAKKRGILGYQRLVQIWSLGNASLPQEYLLNRPFSRWRHLTTTTRIHFVFAFLFKFVNAAEDYRTIALICTRKQQTKGFW